MRTGSAAEAWALEEFGDTALGDARRTARLVKMAARAAENPNGKLSRVFSSARELDGAYDFIESEHVSPLAIEEAQGGATARRCVGLAYVRVAVDGSSLRLADHERDKDFGRVGTTKAGARGLKVISALAVDPGGVTLGLLSQVWWARGEARSGSAKIRRKRRAQLPTEQKETRHWIEAIERTTQRLDAVGAHGWFQLDREADAWPILSALRATKHLFTVRSSWDRAVEATGRDKQYLRAHLAEQRPIGSYEIDVPGNAKRTARRARMVMRAAEVTLRLRDRSTSKIHGFDVRVVWVREEGTTPKGEKPLDWLLLTNAPVASFADGREVVLGYASRWRIEDFHRAWKSGVCNVEDTQLRSRAAVIRWATIQAAVAARAERIKLLARGAPERPATDELGEDEIRVLIALKRQQKKRTETVPDGVPTIAQATLWLAELGGYTGKSSGGPPGSTTIGRGLERVLHGAAALRAFGVF
ncbi:MAG: IS4 family transposase [Acidobacteriota bacterium]|nr:IS4 family transposase [Acidobacteriota bacterium]